MTATLERRTGILQENEERYRLMFEANPLPMWVYDLQTLEFLAVNAASIKHYGYSREEFSSMTLRDIRPPEDVPALHATIESIQRGFADARIFRHRSKDGEILDVEVVSHDIPFGGRSARLVLANDVTRRRQLEATLRQAQKMEAVGQLAGGIAHDFNNLLTVISSYSQFLQDGLSSEDPRVADVEEIRRAATRAADLTRQLLAFSRKQVLQPRLVDLDDIDAPSGKMLRRVISEDIELVTVLSTRPALVKVDPGQIEQVLLNLAVNARDSMPQGGCLTIGVSHERATNDAPDQVKLTVTDTGIGMEPETRERIFEPFFTTKPPGQGTGLGQSTVYGIVQQTEGRISVESTPGAGTRFTVLLPAAPSESHKESPVRSHSLADSGTETVLVVEDEPAVRSLAQRALQARGYTVLTAENGEAALDLAAKHGGRIDLVVTDLIMPRMGGRELAARLAESHSSSRVLFTSGYAGEPGPHDRDGFVPGAPFLPKPFTPAELARRVRAVLDANDS
jgi:PAS domain S-box-containing protein